jgi:hypothetical protein
LVCRPISWQDISMEKSADFSDYIHLQPNP